MTQEQYINTLKSELAKYKEALEELNKDLIWIETGSWNDHANYSVPPSQINLMKRTISQALNQEKGE